MLQNKMHFPTLYQMPQAWTKEEVEIKQPTERY